MQKFDSQMIKEKVVNAFHDKNSVKKMIWFAVELVILALLIVFDLCMKDYLLKFLTDKPAMNYTAIDGFLDLTYSENTGAGFGMFKDGTTALTIVTAVVIAAVIVYLSVFHNDSEWLRMPLVIISAGGIGNLVDRIMLGYVRDFFEFTFMDFAIFNVADACVTVGAAWLIIYLIVMIFSDGKKKKALEEAHAAEGNYEIQIEKFDAPETSDGAATDGKENNSESADAAEAPEENLSEDARLIPAEGLPEEIATDTPDTAQNSGNVGDND